jgi:hypothetical protein
MSINEDNPIIRLGYGSMGIILPPAKVTQVTPKNLKI